MRRLLVILWALLSAQSVLALDKLPLSDTDIKKLHAYYVGDDGNAPLVWNGDPLPIALPVNAEKRLVFPEPVQADLNGALTTDQLRIINNDQSLYLAPLKPFATTRLYVTLKKSNKIILLDLVTSDKASNQTRLITLAPSNNPVLASSAETHGTAMTNTADGLPNTAETYVDAIRFAWQQLFAPSRLLSNTQGFARTPMHTQTWVSNLVYGDKVLAHPQVSWIQGTMYITAVELRNKYPHATTLNLSRDLCGDWQAATLYPRQQLKPAGDKSGDSTTLFLISNKPFGDTLEACHGGA